MIICVVWFWINCGIDDVGCGGGGGGGGGKFGGIGNSIFELIISFDCCVNGNTVDILDIFGIEQLAVEVVVEVFAWCRVRVVDGDIVVIVVIWGGFDELLLLPFNGDDEDEDEFDDEFDGKRGSLGSMNVVDRELWSTKNNSLMDEKFN